MEIQFSKTSCQYLRRIASGIQSREEIQEVRLADSLPDIGRVLGCWGQILIRSKEWRADSMRVSGGVMVWVLYAPEDGSGERSVESWIPFQLKWDLPDSSRDGSICVTPFLQSADARGVSARKFMVRVCVSMKGEAFAPSESDICVPDGIPEDVQLLTNTYPVEIPQESGEKLFQMEETVEIPDSLPAAERVIHYEVIPSVLEQKIMAGRLVFRGVAAIHGLYHSNDGEFRAWDVEIPFSQYCDLDRDYGPNATAAVIPILTASELEREEDGSMELKCGIAAQYVIFDRQLMEIVEDAYSPNRKIDVQKESLNLPVRLDARREEVQLEQTFQILAQRIADISWNMNFPDLMQIADEAELTAAGQFQVLYYDEEGKLQNTTGKASEKVKIPSDSDNRMDINPYVSEKPFASVSGDTIHAGCKLEAELSAYSEQGLNMVTGLQVGETIAPDPARPSLILCRTDGARLWDIAKAHGSTVDAIIKANQLQDEPSPDRILLIPVS